MKILIADNSDIFRDRIKSFILKSCKIKTIYEARNGIEAIEVIFKKKPDFVILDIRMPLMSGIEVLKKIRDEDIKIKICILTSYDIRQYREKCFDLGADYFFNKNKDVPELIDVIYNLHIEKNKKVA